MSRAGMAWRSLVVVALAASLIACGKEVEPPVETPKTFTVHGTVSTPADISSSEATIGGHCYADSGYTDMSDDAQVTITDENDTVVAIGKLGDGNTATNEMGIAGVFVDVEIASTCGWPFYISGVPEGRGFYSISIGRRNPVRYERADLNADLALGLGL